MGIDSMKVSVEIIPDNVIKVIKMKSGSKINDLIKKLNLKPDSLIVLQENIPIPVDDNLVVGQRLSILKVASGG
jgi:sulfur carrier protein ThiS